MWWSHLNLPGWAVELIPFFCITLGLGLTAALCCFCEWCSQFISVNCHDDKRQA